jgi:hypothetical protein
MWADEGPIPDTRAEPGLVITQVLTTEPPKT